MFFLYLTINLGHLFQIQLTGQYYHICKLRVEFQRLRIGDIQLGGKMYLLPYLTGIIHHCHISCNYRRNYRFLGRIDNGMHQRDIFIIDNRIDRQVALHPVLVTRTGYFPQIINRKCISRTGTHIQVFYTEIDRIGTCLNSRSKRFARTDRSHYFKIFQTKTHRIYTYLYQLSK